MDIEEEILKELNELSGLTNEDIFRRVKILDDKYQKDNIYYENIVGTLLNISEHRKSQSFLNFIFSRLSKINEEKEIFYYYHALAYQQKYYFLINNQKIKTLNEQIRTKISGLDDIGKSKKYYRLIKNDKELLFQAAINLAGLFEDTFRNYEAIIGYDKVLKVNSNFGMASGNKAISLLQYYKLSNEKFPNLVISARKLLISAISAEDTLKYGGPHAVNTFKKSLLEVGEIIDSKNITMETDFDLETDDYIDFCTRKNLFLNYHFDEYTNKESFRDILPFSIKIENTEVDELNKYAKLSRRGYFITKIFNEIIQDFISARFIYFLSHQRVEEYDSLTAYIKLKDDKSMNSLTIGLIQSVFQKLYGVLDKVSHILKIYYKINEKDYYFKNIISEKNKFYENKILEERNPFLFAIYSLAKDIISSDGIYYKFNRLRNNITHSFQLTVSNKNYKIDDDLFEKQSMHLKTFYNEVDNFFSIIKGAILYLSFFFEYEKDNVFKNKNNQYIYMWKE